jgi:drug/metabolite transporter (DMT)-like permease
MPPRLGVLIAVLFWGVSFVATKLVVGEISPVALISARALIGCVTLITLLALRGEALLPPRDSWRSLLVMGFVGVTFHQLLQAYALTLTSAVNTGWLIGVTPLWSALFSALALSERLGPGKLVGLLVGFLGAALVVTRGSLMAFAPLPSTRGDLLILFSTLNWACYSVIGHGTIARLGPARATTGAMTAGALLLLPLFVATRAWNELLRLTPAGWAALVFLGVCCSALGYLFWYAALARIEASRVAAFLYLEPLVTLAAAVVLLHEGVTLATLVGGGVLVAGVVLVQRARP